MIVNILPYGSGGVHQIRLTRNTETFLQRVGELHSVCINLLRIKKGDGSIQFMKTCCLFIRFTL